MASQFSIPSDYGFVLAAASTSTLLGLYHMHLTTKYRNRAKVPYPNAYASAEENANSMEKYQFSCAQRAHANFGDAHPTFLVNLLIAGLAFPRVAAGLGLFWTFARFRYASGYVRAQKDAGKGRYNGIYWYGPHFGLMVMAGISVYRVIFA